jgi:hypothetical protein
MQHTREIKMRVLFHLTNPKLFFGKAGHKGDKGGLHLCGSRKNLVAGPF